MPYLACSFMLLKVADCAIITITVVCIIVIIINYLFGITKIIFIYLLKHFLHMLICNTFSSGILVQIYLIHH